MGGIPNSWLVNFMENPSIFNMDDEKWVGTPMTLKTNICFSGQIMLYYDIYRDLWGTEWVLVKILCCKAKVLGLMNPTRAAVKSYEIASPGLGE